MYQALAFIAGFAAIFIIAYWYIEVYTARKHWREAQQEVAAMRLRYRLEVERRSTAPS